MPNRALVLVAGPLAEKGDREIGERGIRRVLVDDREAVPRREGLGAAARRGEAARGRLGCHLLGGYMSTPQGAAPILGSCRHQTPWRHRPLEIARSSKNRRL
jgi:hypothetical protein